MAARPENVNTTWKVTRGENYSTSVVEGSSGYNRAERNLGENLAMLAWVAFTIRG
jgi:hypothetical protein